MTGIFSINTLADLEKFLHFAETPNMIKQNQKQLGALLLPYQPDGKPPPLATDNYRSQHCFQNVILKKLTKYNSDINSYDILQITLHNYTENQALTMANTIFVDPCAAHLNKTLLRTQ
jgi:hypothetical protein